MSFFSGLGKAFGKVGKAVGKVGLTVGKMGLKVAGNAINSYTGLNLFNTGGSSDNSVGSASPTQDSAYSNQSYGTYARPIATAGSSAPISQGSDIQRVLNDIPAAMDTLAGKNAVKVEASAPSVIPSWAIPAAILGGLGIAAMAVLGKKSSRRY